MNVPAQELLAADLAANRLREGVFRGAPIVELDNVAVELLLAP
jgi:hypothetical protein